MGDGDGSLLLEGAAVPDLPDVRLCRVHQVLLHAVAPPEPVVRVLGHGAAHHPRLQVLRGHIPANERVGSRVTCGKMRLGDMDF